MKMPEFDEMIESYGFRFKENIDQDDRKDIIEFWDSLCREHEGMISDAEIDSVLSSYEEMGLIIRGRSGRKAGAFEQKLVYTDAHEISALSPIMLLEGIGLEYAKTGSFTNPEHGMAFEYRREGSDSLSQAQIISLDARYVKMLRWLGEQHYALRLEGERTPKGFAVLAIRADEDSSRDELNSVSDSLLQLMIDRIEAGEKPSRTPKKTVSGQEDFMLLSDMDSVKDFVRVAGDSLPENILSWVKRNISLTEADSVSAEEKRLARRALSMVLNVKWKSSYFESIDPVKARQVLDEQLYGMEEVKQRVIETIIQINRTHTLPSYGLLLAGPAGTGKSQIAYAVAKILKLPWTSLDMSTIHDTEALTGSPRIYTNAKPGRIMEAFAQARSSNIVFIINELDKAEGASSSGSPADALLTLLDNLGYTDNYIECTIPTGGVYPIATANDKSAISAPLLTRFAVIDIPDYTPHEKEEIFRNFTLPKVLKKLGMSRDELVVTDEAVSYIIESCKDMPGVRDLEQISEHMAANALYRIETLGIRQVVFDRETARKVLG